VNNELIIDEPGELATIQEQPPAKPFNDFRHAMMTLPVEQQQLIQADYKARRDNFRKWLMSQLVEGVHYGIVPGCEPKTKMIDGVEHFGVWNKKKENGKGGFDWFPPSQWTPKPSLYAAGADFICDLMGVRDEYESDVVAWQQMGSKSGTAVQKCRLMSRATCEIVGESLGAYSHQYDANNAVKMACKCAKVGAVINAYGLRDLFTQDEPSGPPNENPTEKEAAPKPAPRAQRKPMAKDDPFVKAVAYIVGNWRGLPGSTSGDSTKDRDAFWSWARSVTKRTDAFNPARPNEWTADDIYACCRELNIENPLDGQDA
jgi:hypothetical protein